jgi:quercetin dioxygenase-like cupin family protein
VNFRLIGKIDIAPLARALSEQRHRFGLIDWREKHPASAHKDTETIYLRMPKEITPETVFQSLNVAACEAMEVPEFAEAISAIEDMTGEPAARCMIVNFKPGGKIDPHIDQGHYAESTHRYHLPIETNDKATLTVGSETISMKPGEVWWFNKHELHSGSNDGQSNRYHLIVDTFR